jgi:hypothetical protein
VSDRLISANSLMGKLFVNSKGEMIPEHDCDNFPITLTIREEIGCPWELFAEIYRAGEDDAISYEWGIRQNTFIWDDKWLNQEEDKWEGLMYAT